MKVSSIVKEHKRVTIFNCPVDPLTMDETIAIINESIIAKCSIRHVVINVAKLVYMQSNSDLYNSVVGCDIINVDGKPIVWVSKFFGENIPERVAGIDLMENLINLASKKGYKVFFLGASNDIVKKVVEIYSKKYSSDIVAGYRDGYFNISEEEEVAKQIAKSGAHMLFVAISSPKKELFLSKYKKSINIPFVMGVGGSFDVVAGKVRRAPAWIQSGGLEWFFRLVQEPRRMWKRYLYTNTIFIFLIIKYKFRLIFANRN